MTAYEQQLLRLYEAFNARDVDEVLAAMHPDVDWPNGWEGGWLHGRDALRAYWQRQWREIDTSVEPTAFRTEGDSVRVTVHQIVRDMAGTVSFNGTVIHRYLFEDGLVRRMEIQHASD